MKHDSESLIFFLFSMSLSKEFSVKLNKWCSRRGLDITFVTDQATNFRVRGERFYQIIIIEPVIILDHGHLNRYQPVKIQ